MRFQTFRALALCAMTIVATGCGGSIGNLPPSSTVRSVVSLNMGDTPQSGTVGQAISLRVMALYSDTASEDVTGQVEWNSSNPEVATVTADGTVALIGAGETDILARFSGATGVVRVIAVAAPPETRTLAGVVSDSSNGRGIVGAQVRVLDGPNAERTGTTDGNGYYSIPGLVRGSFTVQVTHEGYRTTDRGLTVDGDTRLDIAIEPLPPAPGPSPPPPPPPSSSPSWRGTYNVNITTTTNTCSDITPANSGTLVLSGSSETMVARMTERGITRSYSGRMNADGTFAVGGSGVTNFRTHEFNGGISGRVTGNSIQGTEAITITLGCPTSVSGRIVMNFSGSK